MEKISIVLILLILFVVGCSSSVSVNDAEKDNKRRVTGLTVPNNLPEETKMDIVMKSEKNTYPTAIEKVNVLITNDTPTEYFTGDEYSIEFFDGSVWKKIPLDFAYDDILITLVPRKTKKFSVYLHTKQYNYVPGKYRIRKTVWSADAKQDLTAEFSITTEQKKIS